MIAERNLNIKCYSATQALIADYYSNTEKNACLDFAMKFTLLGGLDTFSFKVSKEVSEPLYNGMTCVIYIDGASPGYIGYVDSILDQETTEATITVSGKGFMHKLKDVVVNKSYSAQTFDSIIKDISNTYLATAGIQYDVATITSPTITGITIEFNDKPLFDVYNRLTLIANYSTTKYRWATAISTTPKARFNFTTAPTDVYGLFEGYNFEKATVETKFDKLINKVLVYRTTSADEKVTEFVASYSDADSIANYGEKSTKIMVSDFTDTTTISKIADAILAQYKEPLISIKIDDMDADAVIASYGMYQPGWYFYSINTQRTEYFKIVSRMETLTGWVTTGLVNTTASISAEQVYTNKQSLKLVCTSGCAGSLMTYALSPTIYAPKYFRIFAYKLEASTRFRARIYDSYGNFAVVEIGNQNEPINEWIEYKVYIEPAFTDYNLRVDKDGSNYGHLLVDKDVTHQGILGVRDFDYQGMLNVYSLELEVVSNIAGTIYFDEAAVLTESYKQYSLYLQESVTTWGNARTTSLVLGDTEDSLVDEISKGEIEGTTAFQIYSKQ